MTRLTARFWVDAYLMRLRALDIPGFIVSHGNDAAGSVLVKLNTLDGQARVFSRQYDLTADAHQWSEIHVGPEREVDDAITRERARDSDLWVVEVEDRQGRHLLDQPGLA